MSFFGDLMSVFVDVGSDLLGFAGDNIAPIIQGGATIAETLIKADANRDAAEANARALEQQADALRQQAEEIRAGNEAAAARFEEQSRLTEPGVSRLRSVIANAGNLTPFEEQQLDEARRQTTTALSGSGLRGSGRATFEAVRGVESDFFNRINQSNLARSDRAASQLAGANFDATRSAARIDQDARAPAVEAQAGGLRAVAGTQDSQSNLANALLTGQAIGDIAGIITADNKGRASRRPRLKDDEEEEKEVL